eukprot:12684885-Prorocentrum_lima.AAC.1
MLSWAGDHGVGIVGFSVVGAVPGPQCIFCIACSCRALCPTCQMVLGWILGRLCPLVLCVWLASCCVRAVVVVVDVLQYLSCGIVFGVGVGCAVA